MSRPPRGVTAACLILAAAPAGADDTERQPRTASATKTSSLSSPTGACSRSRSPSTVCRITPQPQWPRRSASSRRTSTAWPHRPEPLARRSAPFFTWFAPCHHVPPAVGRRPFRLRHRLHGGATSLVEPPLAWGVAELWTLQVLRSGTQQVARLDARIRAIPESYSPRRRPTSVGNGQESLGPTGRRGVRGRAPPWGAHDTGGRDPRQATGEEASAGRRDERDHFAALARIRRRRVGVENFDSYM